MSEEQPKAWWVFAVRVCTNKPKTTTNKMKGRIAGQILKAKDCGVCDIEIIEDFTRDPLKRLMPVPATSNSKSTEDSK